MKLSSSQFMDHVHFFGTVSTDISLDQAYGAH